MVKVKYISIRHEDFIIYNNNRGGGVAIIVKKNVKHDLLPIIKTNVVENIGIKLFTNTSSIECRNK